MTSVWRTSGWVLVGAALILALSLGVRHGFGLFLAPMSADFGWGREVFAFAIALQNLIWGLAGAYFHIVGLKHHTTLSCPVVLQGEDQVLEGTHGWRRLAHEIHLYLGMRM